MEWVDKDLESRAISLSQTKKNISTALESDLKDSEGLVYTQARERDSRLVDFLAGATSSYPWTPSTFVSKIVFISGPYRSDRLLHFSLTNLPPPSLA
ncbi:hypothetical protein EHQ81_09170 [Leptospira selangorensis]|uniref:Uncharacterized protein n=1 Tax=Leptospira selangorensis TaxID=2484982 RepID=A0A5F2C6B7_9LEPT|nr:hypothetical protein EHQ81_09170 [Leptospira selangorensis]TGM27288.1 hypothetical protein EHQ82_03855 [Leptospira selangorensis]